MRMQLAGGQRLGHYDIVAPIGAGGMGAVYRAHDTVLRRTVAIKVLHDDLAGEARGQLLREARAVSALSHPHICAVHNVEEAEGFAFIVMEHVSGRTLQALAGRALPAPQVQRYGIQIARALDHAHAHGIVHRDLKGANIMITDEDDVVVLDFGIAAQTGEQRGRGLTSTLADTSDRAGTIAYMAPERLRGSPGDARSDIWALGIVLYEMAGGAMPFVGETPFAVSAAIIDQPAQPLSESVPAPLRRMIDRCLQKDPARRYQTAGEVVAALDVGETPARRDARWGTGRWALAVAGVVIAALLALVAVTRRERVPTPAATGVHECRDSAAQRHRRHGGGIASGRRHRRCHHHSSGHGASTCASAYDGGVAVRGTVTRRRRRWRRPGRRSGHRRNDPADGNHLSCQPANGSRGRSRRELGAYARYVTRRSAGAPGQGRRADCRRPEPAIVR